MSNTKNLGDYMSNTANIFWHNHKTENADRVKNNNQRGLVLWFTGLSGSGKSTVAVKVEEELTRLGFISYLLDGDNLRHGLNSNLAFSNEDRNENIRRIYEVASLFCDAQIITLVSAISPFEKARTEARNKINSNAAGSFCEIYVKATVETCIKRDTKGLYKKAIAGEITDFTGISSPYEEPVNSEIIIDTDIIDIDEAVKIVVRYVISKEIEFFIKNILETSIYAAYDAGKAIMEVYQKDFSVEYKDNNTPLTEADKKANDIITQYLAKYMPYICLLTEEAADNKERLDCDLCFIVDPLDGTKEFIKKNGEFTVNIGLSYKHKPIMGVVYVPCENKMYYAAKNYGSFAVNLDKSLLKVFDESHRIKVSGRKDNLVVMKSRSHNDDSRLDELLEKNRDKIKSETASGSSIKGCLIAEGVADIYYRFGYTMEWDTCAMQSVVIEAGGVFLQGDKSEMEYNRANSLNDKGFIILNCEENMLE